MVEAEVDKTEAFKTKLKELVRKVHVDENGTPLKLKQQKALRDVEIADHFEGRLQEMLIDGILEKLEASGEKFDAAALEELQTTLLNARSEKDLLPWPIPGLGKARMFQDFLDALIAKSKKVADEMSEITGALSKGVMAQMKAFAAVAELVEGAVGVLKEEGVQLLKGDLPNMIKTKVIEYMARMQQNAVNATKDLEDDAIATAVGKVKSGLDAVSKPRGGTRRKRGRRRTQRYRRRFTASDF